MPVFLYLKIEGFLSLLLTFSEKLIHINSLIMFKYMKYDLSSNLIALIFSNFFLKIISYVDTSKLWKSFE